MEQFDQLLTCAICLDRYRNPKLLPCQHSFCMEPCMEGLVDYVRRQVKCPECRAEHRIPYQGIQGYPTNVTLQRFLELHIELTGEIPDPTTNQLMERCQVCSEKAYLMPCSHCEKKICPECKDAHMDVLKREILRISHQVRRVLHRLEDSLTLTDKNTLLLQQNSISVMEEIDDIYRRLAKALKDRSEYMKHEVEKYLQSEIKNLNLFKYNIEQEVGNIHSNCDLVDKYISPESCSIAWEDSELMDTKDIFIKTMEFIRGFDYEPGDYSRRLRFLVSPDPNTLQVSLATYGDLHFPPTSNAFNTPHPQPHTPQQHSQYSHQPITPGGLMRSKSDHRLTTQFRNEYDDNKSPPPSFGRKYGKDPSSTRSDLDNLDTPSERKGRFRSRFARHMPENTFDEEMSRGGTVRFEGETSGVRRERVLDTEDVIRGPISGLVRLLDSPRVIQRVHEADNGPKLPKSQPIPQPEVKSVSASVVPWRGTSRQFSEEDEISKQKRANKENSKGTPTPVVVVPTPSSGNLPRRQTSIEPRTSGGSRPTSESEHHHVDTEITTPTVPDTARVRKLSPDRYAIKNRSESSDSATSETSSGSRTGAAFTMDEIRQRILSKSRLTPSSSSSGPTNNVPGSPTKAKPPTFRYMGNTPAQTEVSKEEEEDESSSEESSDETESEEENKKPILPNITPTPPVEKVLSKMEKTDIGPLLARSANERRNSVTSSNTPINPITPITPSYGIKKESPPLTVSSYRRTRDRLTSPPPTNQITPSTNSNYSRYSTTTPTHRGSTDYGTGSTLSRSRSTVYDEPPSSTPTPSASSRYTSGLANKYLNRSRHTFDHEDTSSTPTRYSSNTPSSSSYSTSSRPSSYLSKNEEMIPKCKVSKSKSTHDVLGSYHRGGDHEIDDESSEKRNLVKQQRRPRKMSVTPIDPSDESLSSWARYLKNKYGKGDKKTSEEEKGGVSTSTSTSSTTLSNNTTPSTQPINSIESNTQKRLSFSIPGHPYSSKNRIQFKFGSRGSEPGKLTWPRGICCAEGPDGSVRIVVADSTNHRICIFDETGTFLKEFGSYGSGDGEFDCPGGVWVNRIGQFIVSDRYNHRIQVFDPSGRFLRGFGSQGEAPGKFSYPLGVTTDALNFIYVCEESRIQVFQSDGTFVGKFGSGGNKIGELSYPHYIAVTPTNRVIVSDTNNSRIQIFDVNGRVLSCFGGEGSDEGFLKSPRGVAVDESGYILVGDSGNNRIQIFSPDGIFVKSIGSWGVDGEFKGLEGLATANGNIYVVDRVNHSVSVI